LWSWPCKKQHANPQINRREKHRDRIYDVPEGVRHLPQKALPDVKHGKVSAGNSGHCDYQPNVLGSAVDQNGYKRGP
jgi:hypothetical protein